MAYDNAFETGRHGVKRNEGTPAEALKRAVLAYLSECDNPVPDYNYRRALRNQLRTLTGAPAEPRR